MNYKKSAHTKNGYQALLHMYEKRRDLLRQQYQWKKGRPNPEYRKAVLTISRKMTIWRRSIKRIDERQALLKPIALLVEEFTGIKIRGSIKNTTKEAVLARNLFYKFAIEYGFRATELSFWTGGRWASGPTYSRRRFTNSFKTNLHNQVTWRRFKLFMQQHQLQDPQTLKRA